MTRRHGGLEHIARKAPVETARSRYRLPVKPPMSRGTGAQRRRRLKRQRPTGIRHRYTVHRRKRRGSPDGETARRRPATSPTTLIEKKLPSRAHADRRRQHQQVRVAGSTAVHRIHCGAKIRHRARSEIRLHWTVMRLFYRFLLGGPHY